MSEDEEAKMEEEEEEENPEPKVSQSQIYLVGLFYLRDPCIRTIPNLHTGIWLRLH